jgi:hypothetical protein
VIFPSWAFFPVSLFVLAFKTVTGSCISVDQNMSRSNKK